MLQHRNLVHITPGFKAAINIESDWDDPSKIAAYIPTHFSIRVLHDIGGALASHSSNRVFNIHGPYGVGKSHLGLTIAAYLRHPFDAGWLRDFFTKTDAMDSERTREIQADRNELPAPLLVVRLYGSEAPTREALLHALDGALQREDFSNLRPETAFSAAATRITEIEMKYASSVPDMSHAFRSVGYESVAAMSEALSSYKKEALDAFARVHPQFSSGAAFTHHHAQRPGDVYRQVALALQQESGARRRSGIVILWDEFTLHAEKVMADPSGLQYMELQAFLEACSGSGTARLLFISLSHRSIVQTVAGVQGLDSSQRDALNKVAGRFAERSIRSEPGEQYRLIGRVLIQSDSTLQAQHRTENYSYYRGLETRVATAQLFPTLPEDQLRSVAIERVYPLHPTVLYLLPLVSERVAQNDRTLFHFLCDSGLHGLPAFLSEPVIQRGRPNLLTVDRMYPYFAEAIASARQEEIRAINARYRRLQALSASQQRLVDTLLILQVARATALPPTAANLSFALGITDQDELLSLETELEALKRAKVLRQGQNGHYEFRRLDQEVDFEESLETATRDISSGFDELQYLKLWTSRARVGLEVQATQHNQRFRHERSYTPALVTANHLRLDKFKQDGKPTDAVDGAAYWVMPMTLQELEDAQRTAEAYVNPRILLIFPREPLGLSHDLRRYLALKQLERTPAFNPTGLQRDEWDLAYEELQRQIRERLAKCFSTGTAYVGGNIYNYHSPARLEQIADFGMDSAFPQSLVVPHDKLVSPQGNDTQRQHRAPVLEVLLDRSKDLGQFLQHGPAPSRLIAQSVLAENGWLREDRGNWVVGCPDEKAYPAGAAVWNEIESFLRERRAKPISFAFLVDVLQGPPYGVRPRVFPVLLAAVMRSFTNSLEFRDGLTEAEPTATLVEKIGREPTKVTVRYLAVTEQQRYLLEAVMDSFSVAPLQEKNPLAQVSAVVARKSQAVDGFARTTAKVSQAVRACRDRFYLPLGANPSEEAARSLFYEVLPILAGIEEIRSCSRSSIRDRVMPLLASMKSELDSVAPRLLLPVMARVLGCEETLERVTMSISLVLNEATPERIAELQPRQREVVAALKRFDSQDLEASVMTFAKALNFPKFDTLSDEQLEGVGAAGQVALDMLREQLARPLPPRPAIQAVPHFGGSNSANAENGPKAKSPSSVENQPETVYVGRSTPSDVPLREVDDRSYATVISRRDETMTEEVQTSVVVRVGSRTRTFIVPTKPSRATNDGVKAVRAAINRLGLGPKEKHDILALILVEEV